MLKDQSPESYIEMYAYNSALYFLYLNIYFTLSDLDKPFNSSLHSMLSTEPS